MIKRASNPRAVPRMPRADTKISLLFGIWVAFVAGATLGAALVFCFGPYISGGFGQVSLGSSSNQVGDHAGEIGGVYGDAARLPPSAILQAQSESHTDNEESKPCS